MNVNSLIHGGSTPTGDRFRSSVTNVSAFQAPSLPGLRTHLPSLPLRLAALHSSTTSASTSSASSLSMTSSSEVHHGARTELPHAMNAPDRHHSQQPHQATSLAPLRFIIPSSHCPAPGSAYSTSSVAGENTVNIRPAGASSIKVQLSLPRAPSTDTAGVRGSHGPASLHHDPSLYEATRTASSETTRDHDGDENVVDDDGKLKKGLAKRSRLVKNPNRSTKSKARPGLRKGKWTEEEERYATQLTNYFKEGLLPIERGTMLRLYLSQKLNCEPMRITKKFTGGECIGKQVFRPCSPTPESRVRLMQAQLELVALEAAFVKKLKENKEEVPGLTDDGETIALGGMLPGLKMKKRRPRTDGKKGLDKESGGFSSDSSISSDAPITASQYAAHVKRNMDGMDDANAVGLLLDFFYKASRNEDDDSSSTSTSGPSNSAKSSSKAGSVSAKPALTLKLEGEPEPETESEDRVGPMKLTSEDSTSSPIKRMRTLSISSYAADVVGSPKRSRVGSFTLMATN